MKFRKQGISKRSFFIPKDKIVAIALSALLFIARSPNTLGCGDFSLPQPHFEGVSEAGYVSHWEQVGTLDLGDVTSFI